MAVGSVTPIAVYVPFQFSVRVVPLSKIRNINLSPSTGVPIGALMPNVAANAVKAYTSYALISGVTDDADDVEDTLGSMRLLVSVSAPE